MQQPLSPYALVIPQPDGTLKPLYAPFPKQEDFHSRPEPNVVYIGSRGTGKSVALRMEAHALALKFPKFRYALVASSYPDLEKLHIGFLDDEMKLFGPPSESYFHHTKKIAYYPNGSIGYYSHCSDSSGLGNMLGAEIYWLGADELCSIPWELFRKIAASVRAPKHLNLVPKTRGCTNKAGVSAEEVKRYYIDKDVINDPAYIPTDWYAVETRLKDNPYMDEEQYRKQFAGLPPHLVKAWLEGEFVIEGAYFYIDTKRHYTTDYPHLSAQRGQPAPLIYRAIDWGTRDDAVCLWIAVYANGRAIVFNEMSWTNTTAKQVAADIKAASQGMRIVDTYCDPTMFPPDGSDLQFAGTIIEANGIPLSKSRNDRVGAGFAISEWLYTTLEDGFPKLQIYSPRCPMLVKTLPLMRVDPKNPSRIDDGKDHWVIALAYWAMSSLVNAPQIVTPQPEQSRISQLIAAARTEVSTRRKLGSESIRRSR